jgi:hypothetical protein
MRHSRSKPTCWLTHCSLVVCVLPLLVAGYMPPAHSAPVAHAGEDQTVVAGASVTLDGSGSSASDGAALRFVWQQILGTPVSLSSTSDSVVTFTAPAHGTTLRFVLIVSDGQTRALAKVNVSVHPKEPSAQVVEVRQPSVMHNPAVSRNFPTTWRTPPPPEMPPRPPEVRRDQGSFALHSAVQFAPVVEVQLSPGAMRAVELQVGGPSVLLGSARWIGTTSPLNVHLALDGATLATGTNRNSTDNRGRSVLTARTTGAGHATLSVTNTSRATVMVQIILGALDRELEGSDARAIDRTR